MTDPCKCVKVFCQLEDSCYDDYIKAKLLDLKITAKAGAKAAVSW